MAFDAAPGEVTELIRQVQSGDGEALGQLMTLIQGALKRVAANLLRQRGAQVDWQATELFQEAFIELFGKSEIPQWKDSRHLFHYAARLMNGILINRVHYLRAAMRGGGRVEQMEEGFDAPAPLAAITQHPCVEFKTKDNREIEALLELFQQVKLISRRASDVAILKVCGDLQTAEIAQALGVSEKTIQRDWRIAEQWGSRRKELIATLQRRDPLAAAVALEMIFRQRSSTSVASTVGVSMEETADAFQRALDHIRQGLMAKQP